jgi:hypothetical protein
MLVSVLDRSRAWRFAFMIVDVHGYWCVWLFTCFWREWVQMCMIVDVHDCSFAWLLKCMIVHLPSSSHVWLFTYLIREIIKMFMHLSKPVANLNDSEKRNDPWIIVHFQDCWPVWLSMCNISLCMIYCVYDCFRERYVCVYDCLRLWLFTHMIVHNYSKYQLICSQSTIRLSVNFSYFVS